MQTSEWRAERDAKTGGPCNRKRNRDFIMLQLNGRKRYKALYDPGAQVSLVGGPHIAKKLAKHLKGRATRSVSVTPCAPSLNKRWTH
ncbi:unnamed protein product [Trichogramma brassicae]|uniref:Uncharacterized protein n=1 Tax=Trichogramma brassicae TaxID=86971 RepID=A0A6H5HUM1_9HYME|nr:unnamed protein product [Trichogramma brassicae]